MDTQLRVILLEAAPLLLLAALYLGVALALAPALWRQRPFSWIGAGVWLLFLLVAALASTVGATKLDDGTFLGGIDPWLVLALTVVAFVPALTVLARWRERDVLVNAGRRVREAEGRAREREKEADAIYRLSNALSHSLSGREAADRLFDELDTILGVDTSLLAVVNEGARTARGFAARGTDEAWWQSVELDLDRDIGAIVTVARERAPYAVYDVATAPNLNRRLADVVGARSAAFVPLLTEGRVTGVLVAATRAAPRLFSSSDLDLMQELANETALTLGRIRSEEALEEALERERLVAEVSRKVRSELDLDAVLQVAVEEVGRAVGLARCFIRLGEPGGPMPIEAEWSAPGFEPVGDVAGRLPASNLAARERRTVAVGDVVTAPEFDDPSLGGRETYLDIGTHAVLSTPILVFDRMIGIFAFHRSEARPWSAGEIALAEAVAREAGLALHTARLLRENARRLEEQAALLEAGQVLTSDLRFGSVLRRLVDQVVALLRADAADCWIFDDQRRLLVCHAVAGLPERNVGRRIPAEGTIAKAIASGRPVLRRDFATAEDPPPSRDYAVFAEVMDAPITWLGEVRGVLGVCAREAGRFDGADLELLGTFGRLASLALHNAESFEQRERQTHVQRGFYRIAEVLGSSLSLPETLDALAQAACDALGGASALVLEPSGPRLVVAGAHELPAAVERGLAGGIVDGVETPFGTALRDGQVLTVASLVDDDRIPAELRALLHDAGFRALLCTPVTLGGPRAQSEAVVVLFVEERAFSDEDLALAEHLIGAARGALERSGLFEAERRARGLSQRLAEVGGVLATKLDAEAAFAEVVREAPGLLEADGAVLRIREDDELVVRAAAGPGTEGAVGQRASSSAGVAGVVAESRAALAVEDVHDTPRFRREDPLLASAMSACVAVPMLAHGGGLYGVLAVYAREPRTWRDDEVQALVALAATAAATLSSAELYQRVAEEKERSEAILANIADGIVAVDRDGDIVLWNAMAERITGVPASEALGRRVAEVLQRELADDRTPPSVERQLPILRGGKDVWLSLTEALMLDAAGSVAGRVFAFRDVSSERAVEQMKSDFVATVSHGLRTPLTSIYGFAETLLRADVDFSETERGVFLGYIASESGRLIRIVDDLLNVARLEAGTLGLSLAATDVGEVVTEVVQRVAAGANGDHTFAVEVERGAVSVQADRDKLVQIVSNLVDNAVKFSPHGGRITISARRRSETAEIRVADEGVGIPHVDRQRIFTKFYRAESENGAEQEGTGLGLFLARGLVAAMGGRIWVESSEGRGSTFIFELPAATGKAAPAEIETAARS